jgi:hypothetical protein
VQELEGDEDDEGDHADHEHRGPAVVTGPTGLSRVHS